MKYFRITITASMPRIFGWSKRTFTSIERYESLDKVYEDFEARRLDIKLVFPTARIFLENIEELPS